MFADELQREFHEEGNVLAVEFQHLGEHAPDAFACGNQADNRIQHKEYGKETVGILQGFRTEYIVKALATIGIEGQRCQKEHKETNGVNPVQINKAFGVAFDVFLVD